MSNEGTPQAKRPRRPKGTGGLTPIKGRPGYWRARVFLRRDPITGNPRQLERTIKARSLKEAQAELNGLIAEAAEGKFDGADATVAHLLDAWLAHRERIGRRPTTRYNTESIVKTHLKPKLGHLQVRKVGGWDLDAYYASLAKPTSDKKALGDGTIRLHHNLLSGAFTQAVKWGWINRNPAKDATPPPPPASRRKAPTTDQVRRLVVAAGDDTELATLVLLDAITGARRGELLGLQWSDVDWDAKTVTMRRARVPVAGGDVTGPLKSKRETERVVQIGDLGLAMLRRYRQIVEDRAVEMGVSVPVNGWLLSPDCGRNPMRTKAITAAVTALGKKAKVDITLHELRHYAATQLVGGGVDVRTAASRLGHDPTVLLRTYSHAIPALDRAAAEMLEAGVLGKPQT